MVETQLTCTYCYRKGHSTQFFVKKSDKAVKKLDGRFLKKGEPVVGRAQEYHGKKYYVQENDRSTAEGNIAAPIMRCADGEKLTHQQTMHNDIDAYDMTQLKSKILIKINAHFLAVIEMLIILNPSSVLV